MQAPAAGGLCVVPPGGSWPQLGAPPVLTRASRVGATRLQLPTMTAGLSCRRTTLAAWMSGAVANAPPAV